MEDLSHIFMDTEEKEAAILGEGYLRRFLEKGILRTGFCILTDKRIYFKGIYLHKMGRAYRASKGDYTIELKDVTGSGFSTARFGIVFLLEILYVLIMTVLTGLFLFFMDKVEHYHFGMDTILWGCRILLVLGLAAVPIYYYLRPFRIFVIEYVTGKIAFLTFDYLEDDMRMFQRELYKAKDAGTLAVPKKESAPAL